MFSIKGLRRVVPDAAAAQETEYDPFGGYGVKNAYHTLRDHYEHAWLDNARSDAQIAAGGYDVGGHCARAMMDAFAGLGVFVEDEIAGRESAAAGKEVETASAAAAEGDGGEGVDGDVLWNIRTGKEIDLQKKKHSDGVDLWDWFLRCIWYPFEA